MTTPVPAPEFSRPVPVDRLGAAVLDEVITATPEECAALARRLGLVAIGRLDASVTLTRRADGTIRVAGHLEADIEQTCVVTLEPFPSHVEDSFSADFSEASAEPLRDLSLDAEHDLPEPIENGQIDIGELTAQFLSLALDPHPRAPGVALEAGWSDPSRSDASPFAVLRKLKPEA